MISTSKTKLDAERITAKCIIVNPNAKDKTLDIVLHLYQYRACLKENILCKHCQTLTHSTTLFRSRSFNKVWNLGHPPMSLVLFGKEQKKIEQLWQIRVTTLTNPFSNFDQSTIPHNDSVTILANPCNYLEKSMYQFWQIHVMA